MNFWGRVNPEKNKRTNENAYLALYLFNYIYTDNFSRKYFKLTNYHNIVKEKLHLMYSIFHNKL